MSKFYSIKLKMLLVFFESLKMLENILDLRLFKILWFLFRRILFLSKQGFQKITSDFI